MYKFVTWEELEKIAAFLKENGYRNGGKQYHCNADHYWYKAFGKDCNHYEEGRSLYQVFLNVYDWRKYWDRDPSLRKFNKAASITATIHVSRTIDEVGIKLDWDLTKDGFDLKDIEDKAFEFFKYVNENFGAPPKE
jgi:hypothetical protein